MVLDDKTNNRFLNFCETIIEREGVVVRCIFDIINTRGCSLYPFHDPNCYFLFLCCKSWCCLWMLICLCWANITQLRCVGIVVRFVLVVVVVFVLEQEMIMTTTIGWLLLVVSLAIIRWIGFRGEDCFFVDTFRLIFMAGFGDGGGSRGENVSSSSSSILIDLCNWYSTWCNWWYITWFNRIPRW